VPINHVGHAEHWDEIDIDGNISFRDCMLRYRRNGRVLALASSFAISTVYEKSTRRAAHGTRDFAWR